MAHVARLHLRAPQAAGQLQQTHRPAHHWYRTASLVATCARCEGICPCRCSCTGRGSATGVRTLPHAQCSFRGTAGVTVDQNGTLKQGELPLLWAGWQSVARASALQGMKWGVHHREAVWQLISRAVTLPTTSSTWASSTAMSMRSPPGAAAVLLQVGPPASAVVAAAAGTAEAAAVRSLEGLSAAGDDVLPPRVASASAMRSCRVRAQCSAASAPPCLRRVGHTLL